MKKRLPLLLAAALCLLLGTSVPATAIEDTLPETSMIEEFLEEGPVSGLYDAIPEGAEELLEERGSNGISETVRGMGVRGLWESAVSLIKSYATAPIRMLVSLVGLTLLCAILSGFGSTITANGIQPLFNIFICVFVSAIVIEPVVSCITESVDVIEDFAFFISTFIPMFAGVIAASGQPVTGAAYNLLLYGICQIVSQVIMRFLVPVLCCYLALSIVGVLSPKMNISGAVGGIKTFVTWSLTLILTVFVGLLSIQSAIASGSDALTVKTGKFFIGSFIPVVGGAISDMFVAAQGCIQITKATVGAFGIVITALTFLPPLLRAAVWYVTISLGGIISDLFQTKELTALLKAISSTLGILLGVLLCFCLLVIISTTLIIVAFKGT